MEERTTLVAETAFQRLLMERALAMAQELERTGQAAPHGQILDRLETAAVAEGREFTRTALEGALQGQVNDLEKKLRPAGFADAASAATTKGRRRAESLRPPVM